MLRAVKLSDAKAISDIYNHYVTDTVVTFEETLVSETEMAQRISKLINAGFPWLVLEDEQGLIVGYAYATQWKVRSAYRFTVEATIYLAPGAEGKGYGTTLYQTLFSQLKAQGVHAVIGVISLPNAASAALHEKFNMKKVAHFEQVGFKFNQWVDVGYWQCLL